MVPAHGLVVVHEGEGVSMPRHGSCRRAGFARSQKTSERKKKMFVVFAGAGVLYHDLVVVAADNDRHSGG